MSVKSGMARGVAGDLKRASIVTLVTAADNNVTMYRVTLLTILLMADARLCVNCDE
ncbi:hypothetical protein [Acidiferrobacter sp. SPIII_3]|jgi:hypothetical protein|uniref:hypothetical protein n=1 Tax=Acidiferrobacter sp. SPIII_3 TaxID=1281578 RepID=UPI00143D87D5|nr:hypothetical protein [Acidiferrobacter sp. SPIII_3]